MDRLHVPIAWVVGAAVALACMDAQAGTVADIPDGFQAIDLGVLPGAFTTTAEAVNNKSEVVGWTQGPFTQLRAFKWSSSTGIVELPPPPGFTDNRATDISENGIICGVAQNGIEGPPRSWRLVNGVYELLPPTLSGCDHLHANAVNDDGTVVGHTVATTATCTSRAFYFSDATGLLDLTALFNALDARDVNNAGTATGEQFNVAYRYHPGTGFEPLGTLPPSHDDGAQGRGINEAGHVVGRSISAIPGPDSWRAFFATGPQALVDISPTTFARRSGEAINNLDHAVGSDGTTSTPEQYPWIWSAASGRVPLTELAALPPNLVSLTRPRGINDHNHIIAHALRVTGPEGQGAAVLLIPAPPGDHLPLGGDGAVDVDDLLGVIAAWGPCPDPEDCPADVAPPVGDDVVNVQDLLQVISDWG